MRLSHLLQAGIAFSGLVQSNARLLTIPSTPFTESQGDYSLSQLKQIIVDARYAEAVDENGQTMIPPTLHQFSETFQSDLKASIGLDINLSLAEEASPDSIFITVKEDDAFHDVAGRPTSEGYELDISDKGVTIAGASPLGAWWGTRSLIQTAVAGGLKVPQGSGVDAPGWGSRGAFLDAGRTYFPSDFLIEMCSYLSFFKQNVFHVHLSDNVIFDVDRYSREDALNMYGAFRLLTDDPAVAGLNNRVNESYTRDEFENIQQKCASRGVTVIPEIEAPGHALPIVQWKPQIGLEGDMTMLNISHPDTIPSMETIWKTFLPWFHSKTVHIGADEYNRNLIEDYTHFVNVMNRFIRKESSHSMRIWGTFTPSQGANVSKDISYQHWSSTMDNAYWDYIRNGYNVLNSDDTFYMVGKYSPGYPQSIDKSLVFNGDPTGGAFAPNIFDTKNATNNPPRDNPRVLGHLTALWHDWGPNATTVSEAYYHFRNVLPALGDKQWGGDLTEEEYDSVFEKVHPAVPAQNLDCNIPSKSDTILKYNFANTSGDTVKDSSGNGYDGTLHGCKVEKSAVQFSDGCYFETPWDTKGRNYTLSFSVKPTSDKPGTLFDGPDSTLLNGNGTISNVTFVSGGSPYSLNYSLPLNTWTDVSVKGRGGHTYLEVPDGKGRSSSMEFLTRVGVDGTSFVWAQIGINAPIATIGKGFMGMMRDIELWGN